MHLHIQEVNKGLKLLNIIDVIGIALVLIIASGLQFWLNELPCPLCLLQRAGLLGIGFGFLLNIRFKPRPAHYSLSLLSAILTAFVALRQIALHVVPGSGGYGVPIFGMHLYTWMFILCMVAIVYISIILGFFTQYLGHDVPDRKLKALGTLAFALILLVAVDNIVSIYMECDFGACPDNPVSYVHKW